jgi:hypothetical protein
MSKVHDPQQNHLLAQFPLLERERFYPQLELVDLPDRCVLYESGPRHDVYFPLNCLVSLLEVAEDGVRAQNVLVGNEGIVGISILLGGKAVPSLAVVQSPGFAYRVSGNAAWKEFNLDGELRAVVLRFTHVLTTQLTRSNGSSRRLSVHSQLGIGGSAHLGEQREPSCCGSSYQEQSVPQRLQVYKATF